MQDAANESQRQVPMLTKLFEYLKAFNDLRYPAVRNIDNQIRKLWTNTLPPHKDIVLQSCNTSIEADDDAVVLKVRRPILTMCPNPPVSIKEWLKAGWQDVYGTVSVFEHRNSNDRAGKTLVIPFNSDTQRIADYHEWKELREKWVNAERPSREAMLVFESLYDWYGLLEREGERVELLIGEGILSCPDKNENFHHPILLQKLEFEFVPENDQPTFILTKVEQPPELYVEFLRSLPEANIGQISKCIDELKQTEYDPLGAEGTNGFLKRVIQGVFPSDGQYMENSMPSKTSPSINRNPVIFIRQRRTGASNIFDLVLQDIAARAKTGELFCPAILEILGFHENPNSQEIPGKIENGLKDNSGDIDILFSKPSNDEQIQIAQRLEKSNCVLVQGPPGTGKTHTIANLIGHLLAKGKRVLVTAHSPKALRVLRTLVVEALQPLCVSVLHKDKQSQDELQRSIRQMHIRLAENEHKLESDSERLLNERRALNRKLLNARMSLLNARHDEARDVVFGGRSIRPFESASIVKEGVNKNDWIPGPVILGISLPIAQADIMAVYNTNGIVTSEDEIALCNKRPNVESLPTPLKFTQLIHEYNSLLKEDLQIGKELWSNSIEDVDIGHYDQLVGLSKKAVAFFNDDASWRLQAIQSKRIANGNLQHWESLISKIEETFSKIQDCTLLVLEHGPSFNDSRGHNELLPLADEAINFYESGKTFNVVTKLTKRHLVEYVNAILIDGQPPKKLTLNHLKAAKALLTIAKLRQELIGRWDRQMYVGGAPSSASLGEKPEEICRQYAQIIQECLSWNENIWGPLEKKLNDVGFNWNTYLNSTPPIIGENPDLLRLKAAVLGDFEKIIAARAMNARVNLIQRQLIELASEIERSQNGQSTVAGKIERAVKDCSPQLYNEAYDELLRLQSIEPQYHERQTLLQNIDQHAPAWASLIKNRVPPHDRAIPPGNILAAWEFRQLHDELEKRAAVRMGDIELEIEQTTSQLLKTTAVLVETKTWLNQIVALRKKPEQKQALGAYATFRGKLTKTGYGVKDPEMRAAARRAMAVAKDAVPVWIMPISEVAESFDPRTTRFDVVIIDEASQCDPSSLFALHMAKQVVVVGDDEQVTPITVGVDNAEIMKLVKVHLEGIQDKELFDGETSLYEFAQIAFGRVIRLVEHFRCAPDIISFSNSLSYKNEIRPLRETSSIKLQPAVVPYRIHTDLPAFNNTNEKEAEVIASLICAICNNSNNSVLSFPKPSSIGVVSLVGDQQALLIDKLLRTYLKPEDYLRHHILCGNAAQFQGDERDIMFLSIVDTPADGPLSLRDPDVQKKLFKRRYNVAASRAKDQMWVVYSLDHHIDLKPGDIRRRLIEHAIDPKSWERNLDGLTQKTESPFEAAVVRILVEKGYHVLPQYRVGAYRIDLVINGETERLAVECDGEIAHGMDRLQQDMERQAILERLGWKFVRIRGSVFYRDQERAMKPVWVKLNDLGIMPISVSEQDSPNDNSSVFKSEIIRIAEELRCSWQQQKGTQNCTGTMSADNGDLKDPFYAEQKHGSNCNNEGSRKDPPYPKRNSRSKKENEGFEQPSLFS